MREQRCRKKGDEMKLLPEDVAELDPNLQGTVKTAQQVLKEVVRGPDDSGTDEPSIEEAGRRIRSAVERKDGEAEDGAIEDYQTAATRALWRDYPDQRRILLNTLYERDDRRREKSGSEDERRRPTHSDGVLIAKPMLSDIRDTDPLDVEWEADIVARVLAGQGPFSNILPSRRVWREYIKNSRSIRVFFDALNYIYEEKRNRDRAIPRRLARWRKHVAEGRRRRPAMKPKPNHRPANWTRLVRDIHIQFTIEFLRGVGVPPRGTPVSGCRIVAEALGVPELTVVNVWKTRTWRKSYVPMMRKYSKDIAIRHGLYQTR